MSERTEAHFESVMRYSIYRIDRRLLKRQKVSEEMKQIGSYLIKNAIEKEARNRNELRYLNNAVYEAASAIVDEIYQEKKESTTAKKKEQWYKKKTRRLGKSQKYTTMFKKRD